MANNKLFKKTIYTLVPFLIAFIFYLTGVSVSNAAADIKCEYPIGSTPADNCSAPYLSMVRLRLSCEPNWNRNGIRFQSDGSGGTYYCQDEPAYTQTLCQPYVDVFAEDGIYELWCRDIYSFGLEVDRLTLLASPTPTPTSSVTPTPSGRPSPPPAPPFISNVRVINITTTTATILWDTNRPTDSQVEYCTGFAHCGVNTPVDTQLVTSHSVNLSGLNPRTTYAFWVKSRDSGGLLATLGYFLFTTLRQVTPTPTPPPPPSPPPVISNVQITNIGRNTATVTWDTDQLTDSSVGICYYQNFCLFFFYRDRTLTTNHSITLPDLEGGKDYNIKVRSRNSSGLVATSGIFSFTTTPNLTIINPQAINIDSTSATIAWDTNYPADSEIKRCLVPYFCWGIEIVSDPAFVVNHALSFTGLNSNTDYYYRITSRDSTGYTARSGYLNFTTLP